MDYLINFTQQEIQLISLALGELPLKISLNLFSKIQQAVDEADRTSAVDVEDLLNGSNEIGRD